MTSIIPTSINLVGNTPLLKLSSISEELNLDVYGKLEMMNPSGSMKDRAASSMIKHALKENKINHQSTIIESSSGNMGIALARICREMGLKFICVTDIKTNPKTIAAIKEYGGVVDLVSGGMYSTDLLSLRLKRVRELIASTPGAYWPNQYENYNNARGYAQLMKELVAELGTGIDYIICATGTCGTLRGCRDYIKSKGLDTKTIAVDAEGSVIFGNKPGLRHIPGHGSSIRPVLFSNDLADHVIHVSDSEAINGCYKLLRKESILAGGSTGAIIAAITKMSEFIPTKSKVVIIVGDDGKRYLDTIYSESWRSKRQIISGGFVNASSVQ